MTKKTTMAAFVLAAGLGCSFSGSANAAYMLCGEPKDKRVAETLAYIDQNYRVSSLGESNSMKITVYLNKQLTKENESEFVTVSEDKTTKDVCIVLSQKPIFKLS